MKPFNKTIALSALILVTSVLLTGCLPQNAPQENADTSVETQEAESPTSNTEVEMNADMLADLNGTFTADTDLSTIEWAASKKIPGNDHYGKVPVQSGTVSIENGTVNSGVFIADMTNLTAEDPGSNERLLNHLKSDDFFAVETHPTATLSITDVQSTDDASIFEATADLTIKGITNPVEMQLQVTELSDQRIVVTAPLTVDRTLWDIRFGSDKFFDNLGDNAIENEFQLDLTAVLTQ